MENFWRKYPMKPSDMMAVKMIMRKMHDAKKCMEKDKTSKEYMKYMKEAYSMIYDYMMEKGVDPDSMP